MVPRHDVTADPTGVPPGVHRPRVPSAAAPGSQRLAAGATAGELLAAHLHGQAAELLRSLRTHHETAGSAETAAEAAEAVRQLRRAARRISGTLHTFRSLLDADWADRLSTELGWLSGVLAREYAYAARLDRLLSALHRLSTPATVPAPAVPRGAAGAGPGGPADAAGNAGPAGAPELPGASGAPSSLPGERPGVGAARAGALLERRLNLSRTRAHSAALRALGSARFHAVADAVAVLASDAPIDPAAADRAGLPTLRPLAEQAHQRLADAVESLPCGPGALDHTLTATESRDDAAWHRVRQLARLARYAHELLGEDPAPLTALGHHLDRHRDAAEAAAAAASAGQTPRIAPATAYALGVLHADQRHAVEAARLAFCRGWEPPPESRRD